jgi:ATP-dependent Clp protease ATP-binding subunit ClpX
MEKQTDTSNVPQFNIIPPSEIMEKLGQYVIGQEDAKKVLSVSVYNHYKRANFAATGDTSVSLVKSNVLIIGPTGCGKTYITSTLAKTLSAPFYVADATGFIQNGIGAEGILYKLIENAGGDVKLAQRGILQIDEVDKISTRYSPKAQGIQQSLLRFIEGSNYSLPMPDGSVAEISTKDILFFVSGAFVGLANIISMREDTSASNRTETELIKSAKPEDFAQFGFIPEFIGRLPVIVSLEGMTKDSLIDILTKPKDAVIQQYKKMFELDGIQLIVEDGAISEIADLALLSKTGARGLRGIMENLMRDIMFKAPEEHDLKRITITQKFVRKEADAIFEYKQAKQEAELEPLQPNPTLDRMAIMD